MLDDVFDLLTTAIDDSVDDEVCEHLAAAWCALHAHDDDEGDGYVDDEGAHRTYVAAYYGRKSLSPVGDSYLTDNPREVWPPEWAPKYAPLLRLLARRERQRDDAALRCLRADAARE